jgi:hypothetical protein
MGPICTYVMTSAQMTMASRRREGRGGVFGPFVLHYDGT